MTTPPAATSADASSQRGAVPARANPTLVTGATGYVGGHLIPKLLAGGHQVRVLARRPEAVAREPWADQVQVVAGDLTDPGSLAQALDGVGVAYYLVHSMDGAGDFVARDRALAHGFADAAQAAGVARIVYLSGLHPRDLSADPGSSESLSAHLGSRVEVGRILLDSGVPTAVLQAGVVVGAGSASFDMLRHLTERLPVMVAPKWLDSRIQPIALDDVVHYLVGAADLPPDVNRTFDVAGPDVMTYGEMIRRYAALTGLGARLILVVPVLTPRLASHWVGAVTPVPSGIARPLVGSLIHDAVAHEDDVLDMIGAPPAGRTGFDEAIARATATVDPQRWRRTARRVGAATAACAVTGSLLTNPRSRWYTTLEKPPWQPPPAAFPVVWTSLYASNAMAAAATIADLGEADRTDEARGFANAYAANLVLNAGWSGAFFRARSPRAATLTAVALALSSADLLRRAAPGGAGRTLALGAYTAWTAFASVLTADIARRNP